MNGENSRPNLDDHQFTIACTKCGVEGSNVAELEHKPGCPTQRSIIQPPRGRWLVRIALVLVLLAVINVIINGI